MKTLSWEKQVLLDGYSMQRVGATEDTDNVTGSRHRLLRSIQEAQHSLVSNKAMIR